MSLLAWSFLEFRVATNVRKLTGSKRIYFWQVVQKQYSCKPCVLPSMYTVYMIYLYISLWCDLISYTYAGQLYVIIYLNVPIHTSCSPILMGCFFFYATWQPLLSARLLPMGLPEDVTVIAWGIGCERWTALLYNIRMIKDTSKSLNIYLYTYIYMWYIHDIHMISDIQFDIYIYTYLHPCAFTCTYTYTI